MSDFAPPIPQHHWLPAKKTSGGWLPLYGSFPYYHVSKDIYDALSNSSAPSALNPFATIALVAKKVEENQLKSAWGTTGSIPYSGSASRYVDFVNGVAEGGSYYGDTGFTLPPAAICSIGQIQMTKTDHTSAATAITGMTPSGMYVSVTTSQTGIAKMNWLVVGR